LTYVADVRVHVIQLVDAFPSSADLVELTTELEFWRAVLGDVGKCKDLAVVLGKLADRGLGSLDVASGHVAVEADDEDDLTIKEGGIFLGAVKHATSSGGVLWLVDVLTVPLLVDDINVVFCLGGGTDVIEADVEGDALLALRVCGRLLTEDF
jgi:hypothetical protein